MKGFFVRPLRVTPSIYFNPNKQILDIRGKFSPENPIYLYNLIQLYLESYSKEAYTNVKVNLALSYFNTSSSKCISFSSPFEKSKH